MTVRVESQLESKRAKRAVPFVETMTCNHWAVRKMSTLWGWCMPHIYAALLTPVAEQLVPYRYTANMGSCFHFSCSIRSPEDDDFGVDAWSRSKNGSNYIMRRTFALHWCHPSLGVYCFGSSALSPISQINTAYFVLCSSRRFGREAFFFIH